MLRYKQQCKRVKICQIESFKMVKSLNNLFLHRRNEIQKMLKFGEPEATLCTNFEAYRVIQIVFAAIL